MREVDVAQLAFPFHIVDPLLKVVDAHAEVTELISELRREAVEQRLVARVGALHARHALGDHLRHLVARDGVLAAIGAVTIAFDDAVGGELGDGVVRPVIGGHVAEGVCCSGGIRAAGAKESGAKKRAADILFH